MKVNTAKMRQKISERNLNVEELSQKIGVNPSTFYRKLKADGLAFTIGQMHSIVKELELTAEEAREIFLQ